MLGENGACLQHGSSSGGVTLSRTLGATDVCKVRVDIGDGSDSSGCDQPDAINILAGTALIGTIRAARGNIDLLQAVTVSFTIDGPSPDGPPITSEIVYPARSGDGD